MAEPAPVGSGSVIELGEALRLSYVPRWSIVPMLRDQTVSDHSWRVALIATDIAMRLPAGKIDIRLVTILAVWHDVEEVRTGDHPSTTKAEPSFAEMSLERLIVKVADYMEQEMWVERWAHEHVRDSVRAHIQGRLKKAVFELQDRLKGYPVAVVILDVYKEMRK